MVYQAVTYAVPDFKEVGAEALEWWWILLAVLGGIVLLILIIFILYKVCMCMLCMWQVCGVVFFKGGVGWGVNDYTKICILQ